MLLHLYLPSFARVPVALTEIGLGAVLMSAWVAFAVFGLSGGVLQYAVRRGWVTLPPPNTTIRFARSRRSQGARGSVGSQRSLGSAGSRVLEVQRANS